MSPSRISPPRNFLEVILIVLKGWNGDSRGSKIPVPFCRWPFCAHQGGEGIGGAGSDTSPNDPNSPESPEKPGNPDQDEEASETLHSSNRQTSRSISSTTRSSSCLVSTIASDCLVLCSSSTGVTTQVCFTSCHSTGTGCDASCTTITSIASVTACVRPTGWSNVVDGEDVSIYEPLSMVGTASPARVSWSTALPSKTASSTSEAYTIATPPAISPQSISSLSISTKFSLTCMADGAPWYSPTSWCDWGSSSIYPILCAMSGITSDHCAYSTLPISKIKPTSTMAAPTNIPGLGGIPGCAAVMSRGALPSNASDPMYNPAFPTGRKPITWQFSTVAWWMWQKTVLTANPAWAAEPSAADYSGIRSFWRREIDNADTRAILDECFEGKDISRTQVWTAEDNDQDKNPFWALLGSPNGNGIQYFLTDNKIALNRGRASKVLALRQLIAVMGLNIPCGRHLSDIRRGNVVDCGV